jgi:hypothetical protein
MFAVSALYINKTWFHPGLTGLIFLGCSDGEMQGQKYSMSPLDWEPADDFLLSWN